MDIDLFYKNLTPTPLTEWKDPLFDRNEIHVFIKHDYLNHPKIQGNKLWKLYGPLTNFSRSGKKGIVSFGGAYSNHLLALSHAAEQLKIPFTAFIRGEQPPKEGFTLRTIKANAFTKIIFLPRKEYQETTRSRNEDHIPQSVSDHFVVWEGGSMEHSLQGFKFLADQILENIDGQQLNELWVSAGTGGTSAGLRLYFPKTCRIKAVPVLKHDNIEKEVAFFLGKEKEHLLNQMSFLKEYHFGGYAKFKIELIGFIEQFYKKHQILLDPIYNAKMFYAIYDQVKQGKVEPGKNIVLLHTGGLQGIVGFQERYNLLLDLDTSILSQSV